MEGAVVALVLLFWLIPIIAAVSVGAEKGRGLMGFTFGFFFGIFGLIAIAAMQPSVAVQARRDEALSSSIAEAIAKQQGGGGDLLRRCPSCFSMIHRQARACPNCGRDVPRYIEATADEGDDALTVSVAVEGCGDVAVDAGQLLMVVQPGWVTVSVCDDSCEDMKHELVLSSEKALEVLTAFRGAAMDQVRSRVSTEEGARILVEWLPPEENEAAAVMVDWTSQFLTGEQQKSHAGGGQVEGAHHGVVILTGEIAARSSEVSIFENALATCVDLSSLWESGQVTSVEVRDALSALGALE